MILKRYIILCYKDNLRKLNVASFLEHDAQQLHVVGVPGLTQLIEDCLFEYGAEVLWVSHTQLPQAAQEQSAGVLLQPLLDQQDHHLHILL